MQIAFNSIYNFYMLKETGIELLADVRAFPDCRKWPQFSKEGFPKWLEAEGVTYEHFSKLGDRKTAPSFIQRQKSRKVNQKSRNRYAGPKYRK